MRRCFTIAIVLLVASTIIEQNLDYRSAWAQPAASAEPPQLTAEKIREAIDDAVLYLRGRQAPDGSLEEGYAPGGGTALAALAMLASGANPASDEQLQKALDWLAGIEPNNTYVRGIRANVWEYALRKVPYEDKYREMLKVDFDWLMKALGDKRGWRYQMESRDWDNSCTQYGVLGIWAASRAGFEPGEKFWNTLSKHFRDCQNADGGWGYQTSASNPNMATAGLASMFLVFDMHQGRRYYTAKNPDAFATDEAAEVLKSIERGMEWLGKSSGDKNDGYYLYGIERTGVASGRKYIGGEDWFKLGATNVLRAQAADGSIRMGRWGGQVIGTSFCTLFLVYGGAPVALNKLQYGEGRDWNLNPRDLANLSKEMWSIYERPLNWQTVAIDAPATELEAPILFISGSKAAKFTDAEALKLREYILRGGTILAEPSDHSEPFARSMEGLFRQMFPAADYPDFQLNTLADDHDIYTVIPQEWKSRPQLRGVSDGSRVFFVLSEEYMSADWQVYRKNSDSFKMVTNLLYYATDLGTLEGRFASILPDSSPAKPREITITVARLRHGVDSKHPRDWDSAGVTWTVLAPYAKHVTGCQLKEAKPVGLSSGDLKDVQLLHLTGRHGLVKFSSDERKALKEFVQNGGTLLVDAFTGSSTFAQSARQELEATFGKLTALPENDPLATGRFEGGVDLSEGIRFKLSVRQLLRKRGDDSRGQKLQVAVIGNRPAVIFSEFDLSAAATGIESYRALGYKPKSARQILGNILAYVQLD